MKSLRLLIAAAALALSLASTAAASSAPDAGRAFIPHPASQPLFAIAGPESSPAQRVYVRNGSGDDLYLDVWLPAAKDGHTPPARLPVVLEYTQNITTYAADKWIERLVPRGYVFVRGHMRGFGKSGGCSQTYGKGFQSDVAAIVDYLAHHAAFSDGNVGMWGRRLAGLSAVAGAVTPVDGLRTIIAEDPISGIHANHFADGVPRFLETAVAGGGFFGLGALQTLQSGAADRLPERPGCQPGLAEADLDGDFNAFWAEREYRRPERVHASVLYVNGLADFAAVPAMATGFFDRLKSFHRGIFGIWDFEDPDAFDADASAGRYGRERADYEDIMVAWFDRFLKGIDTDVESWPKVQVQGTDGQWRAESTWPHPHGKAGQFALGPGGRLGLSAPAGSTSYREGSVKLVGVPYEPGAAAVWQTAPLAERLELTGEASLDLWVQLDRDDAHVSAQLEALGANGERAASEAFTSGGRSMQHLAAFDEERFAQAAGKPAPVGKPIHTRLRLFPHDLVVPRGGRLRLTIAGSVNTFDGLHCSSNGRQDLPTGRRHVSMIVGCPTQPSGAGTQVTVLHDCAHPTVLRFAMPDEQDLLNVREPDEGGEPADNSAAPLPVTDGGGVATRKVCGQAPQAAQSARRRARTRRL